MQHQKEGKKLVGCLPLRMCSESAEEAKFATLQEYVPESKEERIVGTVCLPLMLCNNQDRENFHYIK